MLSLLGLELHPRARADRLWAKATNCQRNSTTPPKSYKINRVQKQAAENLKALEELDLCGLQQETKSCKLQLPTLKEAKMLSTNLWLCKTVTLRKVSIAKANLSVSLTTLAISNFWLPKSN
jgi:hypothetical protein